MYIIDVDIFTYCEILTTVNQVININSQMQRRDGCLAQVGDGDEICEGGCAQLLQLCPTLCDPLDYSPSGSSVHGILLLRVLEWVVMPFSRGPSPSGIEPMSPASSALQVESLLLSHQGNHERGYRCQFLFFSLRLFHLRSISLGPTLENAIICFRKLSLQTLYLKVE